MSRSTRSTAPSKKQRDPLGPRLAMIVGLALVPIILIVAGYTLYVYFGVLSGASTPTGTLAGLGVQEPASIVRDERGIPHIRARNRHDMFFLEGYAQGTDRLFQLDLYRRIVAGRLAEIFGKGALDSDF